MANKKIWRDGAYQIVPLDAAEIAARAAAAAAPLTVPRLAFIKAAAGAGRANALLAHLDGRDRIKRAIWGAASEISEDDPDMVAARDAAGIDAADWRAIFEAAAGG